MLLIKELGSETPRHWLVPSRSHQFLFNSMAWSMDMEQAVSLGREFTDLYGDWYCL